ncbi:MAG: ABC transporter ATP-binding protein [Clostridia bacterium]|nr:ABC transporter ATP-binding protein [Clostridia bacterium]
MVEDVNLIEIRGVYKQFDDTQVLKGVSLNIRRKEFVTLLGPSGCGKTTLLRILGGFEEADGGQVLFDGRDIKDIPPHKRRLNTVFQKYALFTHLNVYDNIAFGLKLKKPEDLGCKGKAEMKAEIERRVKRMLKLVKMEGYERRRVNQLSGGQQQRIAIARALVNEPEVLLLDEPLGALDLKLRKQMQLELKSMQQQLGITFIYVTHDQEEALTMSDTIVVMNNGEVQQIGDPKGIYDEPVNAFVADFIGESNILSGKMLGERRVSILGREFECVDGADTGFAAGEDVDVVIRPEDLILTAGGGGSLFGTVTSVIFKGVHYEMMVDSGDFRWKAHSTVMEPVGSTVCMSVIPFNIQIMHKEG